MIIFDLFEDANKNPQGVAEAVNPALANLTPDEIKGIGTMIQNGYDIPTIIRIFDNKPTAEQITAIATANMQQGVAEGTLNELAGYSSDKAYQSLEAYKRYDVYVSRKKFNNIAFIAVAENPRTRDTAFKARGNTPQEAVDNLKAEIDREIDVATKVSGQATLDFNVDFVKAILELSSDTFYAKIVPGPRLVIAGSEMLQYPDIMKSEGFKPSTIRTSNSSEGTTPLPGVPLSPKAAMAANLIANGRYVLGDETVDRDGNRVFDLNFDSVVQASNDKMRLRAPAVTVGTNRSSGVTETAPLSRDSRRELIAPTDRDRIRRELWKYVRSLDQEGSSNRAHAMAHSCPTWGRLYRQYNDDISQLLSTAPTELLAQALREIQSKFQVVAEGSLEEIDRRGFLKGLGAAAVAAVVPTVAKGQTIGGGEEEAKDAATKAGNLFLNLSKGAHREVAQWVSNTVYSRVLQYYNFGGQQINVVTDVAIKAAYQAVNGDFQMVYQAADKDKEDTSLAGTYLRNRLGNRFGVDAGGRDSQLKMAGSLERFNLAPIAEKFVKEYTRALQEALTYFKQQTKESVNQGVAEGQYEIHHLDPEGRRKAIYHHGKGYTDDVVRKDTQYHQERNPRDTFRVFKDKQPFDWQDMAESAGRGEYYIWTVHFANPEKNPPRRVRVYSDEFVEELEHIKKFYAKKGLTVVDVDTDTGLTRESVAEGQKLARLMRKYVPGSFERQVGSKIKDQQFTQLIAKDTGNPINQKEIDQTKRNIRRLKSVGQQEVEEGSQSFHNGMQVKLTPEYADRPDEVFTVAHCDRERGRCWIGDEQGRGWYASFDQLIPVDDDEVDEGEVTKTATGIRHRSTDAYGGTPREPDPLRTLDKHSVNRIDHALGVKFNREKKWGAGLDLDENTPKMSAREKLQRAVDREKKQAQQDRTGLAGMDYDQVQRQLRGIQDRTKPKKVDEDSDNPAVEQAIARRIMVGHTDLLLKYGPRRVMRAVEQVADHVGPTDEIGTSDVSGWVRQVEQALGGVSEAKAIKTRLDPHCWTGKKIGTPKTKVKNGVRVNNCVPK